MASERMAETIAKNIARPQFTVPEIPIKKASGTQINKPKIESNKKAIEGGNFL